MNAIRDFTHRHRYLLFLVLCVLFIRVALLQMIGVGGADPIGNWFFARQLLHGMDYELFHRSARFGTVIPLYLSQLLFGDGPLVYYVAPVTASVVLSIFQFKALRTFKGDLFSFVATLLTAVFPEIIKRSSHTGVEIFSSAYFMVMLYYLLMFEKEIDTGRNGRVTIGLASFFIFLMYLAKEDSLFFLPVLLVYVWTIRKSLRDMAVFASVPFVLFIAETLLYTVLSDFPLGRLSVITSHVSSHEIYALDSFFGLFGRYAPRHMDVSWRLALLAGVPAGAFLLMRESKRQARLFVYLIFEYLFLMTFLVKSIDPIVPFNAFRSRYLTIVAPLLLPVICFAVVRLYSTATEKFFTGADRHEKTIPRFSAAIMIGVFLCSLSVFVFNRVYRNDLYRKVRAGFAEIHPLRLVPLYRKRVEDARKRRLPFVIQGRIDDSDRYRPVFEKIDSMVKRGLSVGEACKKYGISLELYQIYVKNASDVSYSGLYFIHRIFWHPESAMNVYTMEHEIIRRGRRNYRIVFQDGKRDRIDAVSGKGEFVYVPYDPFKVIPLYSLDEIAGAPENL